MIQLVNFKVYEFLEFDVKNLFFFLDFQDELCNLYIWYVLNIIDKFLLIDFNIRKD